MAYDTAGNDRTGGESAWVMHQMQDSAPYSGYPSNYWYPHTHTSGPYGNAYPPGSEVNGQPPYQPVSGYPNGVYNPGQYSTNVLHPSNPFYCADQMPPRQPHYHSQGCPERGTGQPAPPPYPVQHCQGGPGYHPSSYQHYGEGHSMPPNPPYPGQQAMHARPSQPEAWAHSGGYSHSPSPGPQQQWQPGNQAPQGPYGNHVRPPHPPPWQGPAPPPYEHHKEHQFAGQHRPQPLGPKPRPGTPNQVQSKPTEFSAPPQIYKPGGGAKVQEPKPAQAEPGPVPASNAGPPPPTSNPGRAPAGPQLSDNPSLARVQQVLFRVQLLQEDVDEFVGKKTDKSYRYLEELLTKELLELDSVETNGQEGVRLARKEAVQRIQGILDQLEKKAF